MGVVGFSGTQELVSAATASVVLVLVGIYLLIPKEKSRARRLYGSAVCIVLLVVVIVLGFEQSPPNPILTQAKMIVNAVAAIALVSMTVVLVRYEHSRKNTQSAE